MFGSSCVHTFFFHSTDSPAVRIFHTHRNVYTAAAAADANATTTAIAATNGNGNGK